ncbi:MAG: V-type ATPase 116kDa subunit family protein, partial [bacterium]|nr:V-type ATPase 116kDa subunit family protein [bacterium]
FSISGWVPEQRLGQLRGKLESVTENVATSELAIEEGEEPPVLLENNAVVSPFETVTNIYGAPKSTELDPTPYLAPFFILFFAICLSDAGYGLLLAGLSYGAIKLFKLPKENQGFFRLFVYAGIMTFVVGVLFGGWFGLVLEDLPENAITSLLLSLKVIDPVTSPLTMLVISLALGVVQIIVGITVNLYYQLKRKNLGRAFDAGAWLFFMFGVVFWLLAGQVFKQEGLQAVGLYWIYAALAVLVLTQGRRQKNIFMKLPSGILSLYSLVGYFSDVMSYSRLLALGLSTGIIAMVVNMVALLFRDMIPFVGWPVAVAILIGGHAFNLAINTLGSFIHSGRLQYVEFFPKFMEGGGSRFKPFAREAAYIHLPSYEAETIEPRSD